MLGFGLVVVALVGGMYLSQTGLLARQAPGFSLPGVYGGRVDLDSYRGRSVLLIFWTTSCPICQHELPKLSQMEPVFRGKGVTLLPILLGGENEAGNYLSSHNIDLTSLVDSDSKVAQAYGVGGVPKFVLIDRDGKIRHSASGWTSEKVLLRWADSVSGS